MQTEQMSVTGMTCDGCASKVAKALNAVNGVKEVQVSVSAGIADVQFDERVTSPVQLRSAVHRAGYGTDTDNAAQREPAKGGCCG